MRKLVFFTFIPFIFISCNPEIKGEGVATDKKEFLFENIKSMYAICNCDITLIPSDSSKLVIESHQNLIDNLDVTFKKGKLEFSEKKSVKNYDLYNVNVYISPKLEEIELKGQAKLKTSGTLKENSLTISTYDQSKIDQSFIDLQELELSIYDQSQVSFGGTSLSIDLKATDQSIANLLSLQAIEINLNTSGNSVSEINVLKDLKGKAEDNSQVFYLGDPSKDTNEKDKAVINKK